MLADQSSPRALAGFSRTESVAAVLDLDGSWQFRATDEDEWMAASVPGSVHADLFRAARLHDPYYRDEEFKVQWVEKKEWEYRRVFPADERLLSHDMVVLQCRGLDTIAEVYINGSLLASTRDMFIEYEFDVKPLLHAGQNEIHVVFRSILAWNKQQVAAEPRVTWDDEKGNYFFARKCAADFGWDWGLRLLGCGIWRSIRIVANDTARISDLHVRQDLSDPRQAILKITAEIEHISAENLQLETTVLLDGKPVIAPTTLHIAGGKAEAELPIDDPQLWWPNGRGGQPLYTIVATLRQGAEVVHTRSVRIGLRTIELVQEKDGRGQSFGFKVNGHLIFCKGANWIPIDALRDRLTIERYESLLQSCQEANYNMIRLWAGGIYEADCFYDYCDEHGIMIWHDFMFACGPYVGAESYLENVRAEISSVVKRLRSHPSIILWCGNNEQESDMSGWVKKYKTVTWREFDKVFCETIPQTAFLHDPERLYWPGSPHHPLNRQTQALEVQAASGDAHLWQVWHDEQPFSWYTDHLGFRFVSEFGLLSLPHIETIRSFTAPEDRHFASYILDLHNKTGKKSAGTEKVGNTRIARYVAAMHRMPSGLRDWVYCSQVTHAEAMKTAVEAYRRSYPAITGALYWQIGDNWPTISYSSIDYYGRWKALQYFARRFFSPILVCGSVEGGLVRIWGVNDLLTETRATLQWTLARFDGQEIRRGEHDVTLPPNGSMLIATLDCQREVCENPDHTTYRDSNFENRRQFFLAYKLIGGGSELSANVSFFSPPKYWRLVDHGLASDVSEAGGRLMVTVRAKRFAAFVELSLDSDYAHFSDNYFHLLPGEARQIEVKGPWSPGQALPGGLRARSLIDSGG